MAVGTVRYWAAARAAAGVETEEYSADTLADVIAAVTTRHGAELGRVLRVCSYVVDAVPVGGRDPATVVLPDGATVEVLPPFAGG